MFELWCAQNLANCLKRALKTLICVVALSIVYKKMEIVSMNEIEEIDEDNIWRSCSGCRLDRRATVFFSQLFISVVVICFCIYQLVNSKSCERDSLYSGILTMVIGIFIPSPRIGKR